MSRIKDRNRKLKLMMFSHGIYQTDIAEITGYSRGYVNEVVNGKKPCKKINEALADALKITVDDLPWDKRQKAHKRQKLANVS